MKLDIRTLVPVMCTSALLVSAAAGQPGAIQRKVLIVGVDGMRADCLIAAPTPTFDSLIAAGAVSYRCSAEDITISGPGWSSILTAVHRNKHLVVDNSFVPQNYVDYPHFFARLQQLCDARTASICDWAPINTQIAKEQADVSISGVGDDVVTSSAIDLVANSNPDVVFLHFDACDHAGHAFGFDPSIPEYLAAITQTDAYVGQILTAIRARPTYAQEDWLTIVTSDHGGTIDRTHGRNIPEHRLTTLIVSGRSTSVGTTITPDPQIVDVPATVMTFLGLPINPAWGWDGVAVGLNMPASTSTPFPCSPPPPPPLGACSLRDGRCMQLRVEECTELRGVWGGLGSACRAGELGQVIFSEDFNGLPLGPNVNETVAGTNVWTGTAPAGWVIDNSGVPTGGVTEWRGWTFASPSWWSQAAGDQSRSGFTKATGAVCVADPDEWDDLAHAPGTYDALISTRAISLAGVRPESAHLFLDSSWRPEANQHARLTARFDGGVPVTLLDWTSQPGPNFKPDALNETLAIDLHAPHDASSMVLTFGLTEAGNNWWWAIDNLEVVATPVAARRLLLLEDFESVPLGPNVNETLASDRVWSGSPPAGWVFDDTGVPTVNDPARGVKEWEGWAVTNRHWWTSIAGDQRRSEFLLGTGAIAVADPDEWDDRGTPAPNSSGPYNALMKTREISLAGITPNSLQVSFASSWRPEAPQQARLTATFDTGQTQTLFLWDSAAGPNFKPDATNELLTFPIANPPGAASVRFTFEMLNARNNWWWAIDNVSVTGVEAVCGCGAPRGRGPDFNCDGTVDPDDLGDYITCFFSNPPCTGGDFNADGEMNPDDLGDFITAYFGPCN